MEELARALEKRAVYKTRTEKTNAGKAKWNSNNLTRGLLRWFFKRGETQSQ